VASLLVLAMSPAVLRAQIAPGRDVLAPQLDTARWKFFFNKGRSYGTDAYSGPFDVILNKGFAVAQWQGRDRDIFSFPYGWSSVWASVTRPGKAMEQAGG